MDLKKKTNERVDRLSKLGLKFNGQEMFKDDFNVHWTEITLESDESFNKIVEGIEKEMKRRAQ